jgi:hypothetical protein
MKTRWTRLSLVTGLAVGLSAGAMTLAVGPRKNRSRCPQNPACTTTCDPANQQPVTCWDGGQTFQSTFACCCCNDQARNRWFTGH